MRSRLRLFAVVGLVVTAVDLGVFLTLVDRARGAESVTTLPWWQIALIDVAALTSAALVSYVLNRWITFHGMPQARWVRNPALFAATALVGGAADVLLTVLFIRLGVDGPSGSGLYARFIGILAGMILRWGGYRWVLFNEVRRDLSERRSRPPAPGSLRLSVVVPAYEEAASIAATVTALRADLEPVVGAGELEILVVDDGSADQTAAVAERAGATVWIQPENRGKGAAVRAGVLAATGRTVVFTDADLAYPPSLVARMMEEIESGWDIVVGSRRHEETNTLVRARRVRELGGRMINWLTHLVLLGHFRDTQCGIKGFRSDIGKVVFERTTIDGFAFDVEVFLIAEQDQLSLCEIPVAVQNRNDSSVRLVADSIALFRDLVRIRRMAGWGRYRPSPEQRRIIEGDPGQGLDHRAVASGE